MIIDKPIPESQMPEAKRNAHYKYFDLYTQVMKLPKDRVLPVILDTEEQAKKFMLTVQHSNFARFRAFRRDKTVYLRLHNEKDEAQRQHILKLRELAKSKKAGGNGTK